MRGGVFGGGVTQFVTHATQFDKKGTEQPTMGVSWRAFNIRLISQQGGLDKQGMEKSIGVALTHSRPVFMAHIIFKKNARLFSHGSWKKKRRIELFWYYFALVRWKKEASLRSASQAPIKQPGFSMQCQKKIAMQGRIEGLTGKCKVSLNYKKKAKVVVVGTHKKCHYR